MPCPISGLMQCIIILVTFILLFESVVVQALRVTFVPRNTTLCMYESVPVNLTVEFDEGSPPIDPDKLLSLSSEDVHIAETTKVVWLAQTSWKWEAAFNISGNFLGKTRVVCRSKTNDVIESMPVTVIRKKRVIDTVFTSSVAMLVSIIYINFGCALNWSELKNTLRRPIGPVIGFFCQFLIMPVLSFVIGKLLFPESPEMQLGMFFTGVSPAGGASNIWTVMLDGNMDLSITMTTISTIAAFGMMPLWIFSLGKVIFDEAKLVVPYSHISYYAIGLVIPLAIGYLISRYLKSLAQFLTKILKGFSGLLIAFIVVFAIVTNLYLFELFSWKIVIAGMGLPYIGYLCGYIIARVLKQPAPDCLAIAIETGIQNTGIAIFLLRFALPQPEADLTTVAPVAVAVMTPFPLIMMFIYKKIQNRSKSASSQKLNIGKEPQDTNMSDGNCLKHQGEQLISTIS